MDYVYEFMTFISFIRNHNNNYDIAWTCSSSEYCDKTKVHLSTVQEN